jgi:hypothetical protein
MKRIFKYKLEITDFQQFDIPLGAVPLTVQSQEGEICLWAEVDDTEQLSNMLSVWVVGTGGRMLRMPRTAKYISTVQLDGFVWHIYIA